MKYLSISFLICLFALQLQAQADLSYYLPQNVTYNKNIPTPKDVLGYEVGEWHVGHDQLVYYMQAVAKASDRVTIKTFARTYENRPLVVLTITSPDNHKNLEWLQEYPRLLESAKYLLNYDDLDKGYRLWQGDTKWYTEGFGERYCYQTKEKYGIQALNNEFTGS